MRGLIICIALLVAVSTPEASAQVQAEALGTCLTDNTTGRDRKDLARWIFTAMAAHPEMDSLSAVTPAKREEASRRVGALFTRLFSESCTSEVEAAMNAGNSVIEAGFGILGQVAMHELMQNNQVSSAMEDISNYIDMERLQSALQEE